MARFAKSRGWAGAFAADRQRLSALFGFVLRDDLDENGGGDLDFEAAAGSGVMIVADLQLCKFFRRRC